MQLYGSLIGQIVGLRKELEEIRLDTTQVVGEKTDGVDKEEILRPQPSLAHGVFT